VREAYSNEIDDVLGVDTTWSSQQTDLTMLDKFYVHARRLHVQDWSFHHANSWIVSRPVVSRHHAAGIHRRNGERPPKQTPGDPILRGRAETRRSGGEKGRGRNSPDSRAIQFDDCQGRVVRFDLMSLWRSGVERRGRSTRRSVRVQRKSYS
jgi:hypothetical protein